ncbi:MAG TPA: cold shock domain-containing protein [Candidatus Paceibacterota bacterium]|jgi:cold shock CspA family protein|nr:cold shock domain-containing protein [Candidatus Paceibacterota bacterium]
MTAGTTQAPIETGRVKFFNKGRGYGFVDLDNGGDIFFFVVALLKANRENIHPGVCVTFRRGLAKDGRPFIDEFIEIEGMKVAKGEVEMVDGRWVLLKDRQPTTEKARPVEPAIEVESPKLAPVSTPEPAKQDVPAAPRIDEDEWIPVAVRKVRPDHTSYAVSECLGQIKVPWNVMQAGKIKGSHSADRFEVRCREGDDLPVAYEIRRY